MTTFGAYTVVGIVVGCIYALTASGLVVTYTTSRVFNFAHGAIGMTAAFLYWQFSVAWGWPAPAALLIVLLVIAPLFGALVERVLIRNLYGRSTEVSLVVTLGLLISLIGVANWVWKPNTTRVLPQFFAGRHVALGSVQVSYHQIVVVSVAVGVALALRLFFTRTRVGIAMRAVVDNPALAALSGARSTRIAQMSWAIGAVLASLAGVLLAPLETLDVLTLTLLIINAFAAAMMGRLKSLPLTVVGGLSLGLAVTYGVGYLPIGSYLSKIQSVIPMVFLFVVLIVLRHEPIGIGNFAGARAPRVPPPRQSLLAALAFVVVAFVASGWLSPSNLVTGSRGLALALILLSLVLLTGYGGQVSLCQFTFVGLGAFAMGSFGAHGSLLGVLAAVGVAAGFGALVAIPTLRLRGLYLALATLAFAQAMDYIFFDNEMGSGGSLAVPRVRVPGIPTTSDRAFFNLLAVVFAVSAVLVLALRRGRYGRQLAAMSDSPVACVTLGLNTNWAKLRLFTTAAGLAGLGGALYGAVPGTVSPNDFVLLNSLVLLLLLVVGGRNTVSGAFFGAMLFALFPLLQQRFPSLANLRFVLTGVAAISLGRNPNGLGGSLAQLGALLRSRRQPSPAVALSGPFPTDDAITAEPEVNRLAGAGR